VRVDSSQSLRFGWSIDRSSAVWSHNRRSTECDRGDIHRDRARRFTHTHVMSYQRTTAGRTAHSHTTAAATPPMPVATASHYFMRAGYAHGNATRPAYIDVVHSVDAPSKRALLNSSSSTSRSPPAPTRPAAMLLPHMDDLDEEIQALGYEKAMVAGATAGVVEHVFMFPVDTIKTRMQALQGAGASRHGAHA
jgi:hypothetical protein